MLARVKRKTAGDWLHRRVIAMVGENSNRFPRSGRAYRRALRKTIRGDQRLLLESDENAEDSLKAELGAGLVSSLAGVAGELTRIRSLLNLEPGHQLGKVVGQLRQLLGGGADQLAARLDFLGT